MATTLPKAQLPVQGRANNMFRAFSYRNYRLFWAGAFLSNIGTWMQAVAQGLLMYNLTSSPFWLGLDGFMATIPGLFLTLAGGVFADRIDRRRLLLITQAGAGFSALILAILIATGLVQVWTILLLSFFTGCCMAMAGPSYQALTVELVSREDLANAIALNSTQFQLSRVIGPALAGVALTTLGMSGCFFANAASYLAVIGSLALVRFEKPGSSRNPSGPNRKPVFARELKDGLRYVWGRPRVFWLLIVSGVTSLFGAPYITMMPVFAREVFHLNDSGLSLMMATAGAGAFVGALTLAYMGDFRRKAAAVLVGGFFFGACLMAFSLSTVLWLSLVFLFLMGFSIVSSIAVINTLLQSLVTDRMRGRVMSMFILSFVGIMPFGNLIAGSVSHTFGAPNTLASGGLIISIFMLSLFLFNKRFRS